MQMTGDQTNLQTKVEAFNGRAGWGRSMTNLGTSPERSFDIVAHKNKYAMEMRIRVGIELHEREASRKDIAGRNNKVITNYRVPDLERYPSLLVVLMDVKFERRRTAIFLSGFRFSEQIQWKSVVLYRTIDRRNTRVQVLRLLLETTENHSEEPIHARKKEVTYLINIIHLLFFRHG